MTQGQHVSDTEHKKFDLLGARRRSLQRVLSLDAYASTKEDKKEAVTKTPELCVLASG